LSVFDLILRGGSVVDGTGSPARVADIGLEGDRITSVGDLSSASGETIDCQGLVVSPGFIDIHSHTDFSILDVPDADSKIRQGITTEVVGNCGFSTFPIVDQYRDLFGNFAAFLNPRMRLDWSTASEFFDKVEGTGSAVNLAPLVGHGTVRLAVLGMDPRPPTADEISAMRAHVTRALQDGAWGYSTGLIYAPCSYAQTDEVAAVAEAARPFDSIYFTHMRDEGDHLLEAIDEAMSIGRSAGLRVQLSHFKAAGARNWGKSEAALQRVEDARAAGLDVMFDQYPYLAGSTTLTALLPPACLEGGIPTLLRNLTDPTFRARARRGIEEGVPGWWNPVAGSGWDSVVVADAPHTVEHEGKKLSDIGQELGGDGFDALCELLAANSGAVSIVIFMMSEDDLLNGLRHPLVMVGSDGFATSPDAGLGGSRPHPRTYGCYPRVLGTYVRERGVLPLERAVHKMTGMPAGRLGFTDRGHLRAGAIADLVVFDPSTVADRSTYADPHHYPAGVPHVLVAGQPVVRSGQPTGARPGRVLRRS
jgi:N-acyl-D-amino-acid deacylase